MMTAQIRTEQIPFNKGSGIAPTVGGCLDLFRHASVRHHRFAAHS